MVEYGQVSHKTKMVRDLMERVASLGNNPTTSIEEINATIRLIGTSYNDSEDVFVISAKKVLEQIAEDGVISNEERELLSNFSVMYENPISNLPVSSIAGKAFVLTGDFTIDGGKAIVEDMIKAAGGVVRTGTSRRTAYVVVGGRGSDAWAFGGFGQKVKEALDLKLTGKADVKIVSEQALLDSLGKSSPEAVSLFHERVNRFNKQIEATKVVSRSFSGLTRGQQEVLDSVQSGRNIYLSGLGGTGKSFILNRIIEQARAAEKNVITCAPTGIAALNIGGCTIHRALGIHPAKTLEINPSIWIGNDSPLLECDLMIVDEISMCRMDLFDYLSACIIKTSRYRLSNNRKPCQLIVVGDFCQLPPVVTKQERPILEQKYGFDVGHGYPFMGSFWDVWKFKHIELTEAIRQRDATFVAALNACRVGDTRGLHWIEEHASKVKKDTAVILCGTNDKAEKENAKELGKLPGRTHVYEARVSGVVEKADKPTLTTLSLKPGARVMALINDSESTFMNGSIGTVVQCSPNIVTVCFDNGFVANLGTHTWEVTRPILEGRKTKMQTIGTFTQMPLKLAYALTIHKAQGQTFDAASIYPECWDPGQLYTALSRLSSIDGLHFAHSCPDSSLIASQDVLDFIDGKPLTKTPIAIKNTADTSNSGQQSSEEPAKRKPPSQTTRTPGASKGNQQPDSVNTTSGKPHHWTPEEEDFILGNPSMSNKELAQKFGVTVKAVERKKSKLRKKS